MSYRKNIFFPQSINGEPPCFVLFWRYHHHQFISIPVVDVESLSFIHSSFRLENTATLILTSSSFHRLDRNRTLWQIGRTSSPLKATKVIHEALFYSDKIKLTDIELRSRDYLIIPQTIMHSLQFNHTRCRNYIFLFLKYHSRRIHLSSRSILLFSIAAYFSALGRINRYLIPEQYLTRTLFHSGRIVTFNIINTSFVLCVVIATSLTLHYVVTNREGQNPSLDVAIRGGFIFILTVNINNYNPHLL